jgi:hypothetical protein
MANGLPPLPLTAAHINEARTDSATSTDKPKSSKSSPEPIDLDALRKAQTNGHKVTHKCLPHSRFTSHLTLLNTFDNRPRMVRMRHPNYHQHHLQLMILLWYHALFQIFQFIICVWFVIYHH